MSKFEIPEGLLARCAGQAEVCKRVIGKYIEQMRLDVDEITTIIESDAESVAKLAHRMKGASANVGAEEIRSKAEQIEKLASEQDLDAARPIARDLEKHWHEYETLTAEFLSYA